MTRGPPGRGEGPDIASVGLGAGEAAAGAPVTGCGVPCPRATQSSSVAALDVRRVLRTVSPGCRSGSGGGVPPNCGHSSW